MTDMIGSLRRRAPRFEVKNTEALRVTVAKTDKSFESVQTELVNISAGGAKFKTSQKVTVKEVVSVKIVVEHPNQSISVSGEVRWIAPSDGEEWWLGCAFKPSIPHEVLDHFARQGVLERREYPRQRISLRVSAEWQLESDPTTVTVVDYSVGGLCLVTQSERDPGERVMLRFHLDEGGEVQVQASTRWQVKSDEGYLIGCEFDDPRDFLVLIDLLESRELLESDLCDRATPRGVWKRLVKPGPPKTRVRTARRDTFQQLRAPASWITMGGTMLFLMVLLFSNRLKSSGEQAGSRGVATMLTSMSARRVVNSTTEAQSDPSNAADVDAMNQRGDAPTRDRDTLEPETLLTIDRLLVDAGRSPFDLDGVTEIVPDSTEIERTSPVPFEPAGQPSESNSDARSAAFGRTQDVARQSATRSTTKSKSRVKALRRVRMGWKLHDQGEYEQATGQFVRAAIADPTSPLVRYSLAVSQYQLGQLNRAEHSVERGVALEQDRPIADWSSVLSRYQGVDRIWLDATRRQSQQ